MTYKRIYWFSPVDMFIVRENKKMFPFSTILAICMTKSFNSVIYNNSSRAH